MIVKKKGLGQPQMIVYNNDDKKSVSKSYNAYADVSDDFYEGGVTISDTIDTELDDADIVNLLANIEDKRREVSDFLLYNYISGGDVYQPYTAFKSLPKLEYSIGAFDNNVSQYQESVNIINKTLFKLKYKEMLRDVISQSCLDGGVVCVWCGAGEKVFPYVFDSSEYVYPKYRRNGDWVCVVDLAIVSELSDDEKLAIFENLAPMITEAMFSKYESSPSNETQFIELPQERTSYIRNGNTLRHNQRMAIPLGTQALLDINHKKRMKNLETNISTKANRSIALLTIGSKEAGKSFIDIPVPTRKNIVNGVGKALKQNSSSTTNKVPLAVLPEFCDLSMAKIDGLDGLSSDKFKSVDADLGNDTGIGYGISMGSGSNNAGTEVNIAYIYRRIATILEQCDGFLNKLIPLICSGSDGESLYIEIDKEQPLTKQQKLEALFKLQAQGFSTSHVVQELGINFNDYIEQTFRETDELDLKNRIYPFMSSYTYDGSNVDNSTEESSSEDTTTDDGGGTDE